MKTYVPIYQVIDTRKEAEWEFIKFRGDAAVYAHCTHCDFIYPLTTMPYPYCPVCGRKMYYSRNATVKKVDSYPFL